MSEEIASVSGPRGGYQQVEYANGAQHVYETQTDPATGNIKKIHVSSDDMVRAFGEEPGPVPLEQQAPNLVETSTGIPEVDALRQEVAQLREQLAEQEANNQRRHEELLALLQAMVEKLGNGGNDTNDLPPAKLVQDPEDDGMGRMRDHFANLSGDEDEDETPTQQERLEEAGKNLKVARDTLVDIAIRRKARMWDGYTNHGAGDGEAYGAAMETYKEEMANYLKILREGLEAEGLDEAEVRKRITEATYEEQAAFAQAEYDINNQNLDRIASGEGKGFFGRMWGKRANVLRRWANLSTKKKILAGLMLGAGVAIASGTLGGGIALLAAGSAAKFSLGLLNRHASLRNVSERSLSQEKARIEKLKEQALRDLGLGPEDMEAYSASLVDRVENDVDGRVQFAQRRNRLGNAMLLASGALVGVGAAGLEGWVPNPHIPHFWSGGGGGAEHFPKAGQIDMSHFHPDSFKGPNGDAAVRNAIDVLARNHIHVAGLSDAQVHSISQQMAHEHFKMASGMAANGHQNIVDWTTGRVPNAHASNLEGFRIVDGSSKAEWGRFIDVIRANGGIITQGRA